MTARESESSVRKQPVNDGDVSNNSETYAGSDDVHHHDRKHNVGIRIALKEKKKTHNRLNYPKTLDVDGGRMSSSEGYDATSAVDANNAGNTKNDGGGKTLTRSTDASEVESASSSVLRDERSTKRLQKKKKSNKTILKSSTNSQSPPSSSWWKDLQFGLTLYILCIALPSIILWVLQITDMLWSFMLQILPHWDRTTMSRLLGASWYYLTSTFALSLLGGNSKGDAAAPQWSDVVVVLALTLSLAMVRIAIVHYVLFLMDDGMTNKGFWLMQGQDSAGRNVNNSNAGGATSRDSNHVIKETKKTTNTTTTERMEAFVRVKSIHLLSSAYSKSLTPRSSLVMEELSGATSSSSLRREMLKQVPPIPLPSLYTSSETKEDIDTDREGMSGLALCGHRSMEASGMNCTSSPAGLPTHSSPSEGTWIDTDHQLVIDDETSTDDHDCFRVNEIGEESWMGRSFNAVRKSSFTALSVEEDYEDSEDTERATAAAVTEIINANRRRGTQRTSQENVKVPTMSKSDSWELIQQKVAASENQDHHHRDSTTKTPPSYRTLSRFATALFRMLYSGVACILCWTWFHHYHFWPRQLGGQGHTKHCWDLRGGSVAFLMDDDSPLSQYFNFDNANALLKTYFLLQTSYHLHSVAFHILTMILLWYYKGRSRPLTSYWRSFLDHGISLCLLSGAHLFSATRRLGAIGSFGLDVSSFFLHLLQVCLNAPRRQIPPPYLKMIYCGMVIPSFCYGRFYVWTFVVWYSATTESADWLRQVSQTLIPGVARLLWAVFHLLTLIMLVLNVVFFRRLLHHPHLERLWGASAATTTTTKVTATTT